MSVEWKDATGYQQGKQGLIQPNAWECLVAGARLSIMSAHRFYPGDWVMNCRSLDIVERRLGPVDGTPLAKVKVAALHVVASEAKTQSATMAEISEAAMLAAREATNG